MMKIKIEDHPNDLIDDVKLIRIDGVGVGYCGIVEGSPICFISRQPQSVRLKVKQKVEKLIGGSVSSINEPPAEEKQGDLEDVEVNDEG